MLRLRSCYLILSLACLLLLFPGLNGCSNHANLYPATSQVSWTNNTSSTIWPALISQFKLQATDDNPAVIAQIHWYQQHPTIVNKTITQAAPFLYYILEELRQRNLPGELALLPIIESSYDPTAYSHSGAAGLWQLMPGTATGFGITQNWWYDGRRDVYDSTNAALDYLTYLRDFFDNDWLKAIAAYNSGEGTVQNAVRRNSKTQQATDFFALHLPKQTMAYVPKLLALAAIISHPQQYGITLPFLPNKPMITSVPLDAQIDLSQAAKLAEISEETLYQLNPGYMRWATDPNSESRLFLPIDKVDLFKENVKKLPKEQRVTWQRHKVVSGDSLGRVAKRYDTTVTILRKVNNLHNNTIHIGDTLIVPATAHNLTKYNVQNKARYVGKAPKRLPGPKKVVHTVKAGETIKKIAAKYHLRSGQIHFWNHTKTNRVAAGTQLTLWINKYHAPVNVAKQNYKVKSGDTLSTIAKRYHTNTRAIQIANHLKSTKIKLGQKLVIPSQLAIKNDKTFYTVRSGDTLSQIAKQYNISSKQLMKSNQLENANQLRAGQQLQIYS